MRKLWNRPDLAVWSLSTQSSVGIHNMNICTYVSVVSMDPKLILVAVFKQTQTHKNVTAGATVLLQLLGEDLAPVVRVCGRKSGATFDKIKSLRKKHTFGIQAGLLYFEQALGIIELTVEKIVDVGGDHDLVIGRVVNTKNFHDKKMLTTTYLRAAGYTR